MVRVIKRARAHKTPLNNESPALAEIFVRTAKHVTRRTKHGTLLETRVPARRAQLFPEKNVITVNRRHARNRDRSAANPIIDTRNAEPRASLRIRCIHLLSEFVKWIF